MLASLWLPALATCRLGSDSVDPMQEVNQTGQVLDDTVVGITVGETSISGLQDPVQLTFTHGQLPHVSQLCPASISPLVSLTVALADAALPPCRASPRNASSGIPAKVWSLVGPGAGPGAGAAPGAHGRHPVPVAGQAGGWNSSGCVMQLGDKGTVCSCDHLTFFTLLLVTIPLPAAPAHTPAAPPAPPRWPLGWHE